METSPPIAAALTPQPRPSGVGVRRPADRPAEGLSRSIKWRSIQFKLTAVFTLFLTLVALLGVFAISELRAVNQISGEIRDRWLQSTRVLGDLNNSTSDARAAEASRLLAQDGDQRARVDAEITGLDRSIAGSQRDYLRIRHDAEEWKLYHDFASDWSAYRAVEARVLALSRQGHPTQATALYMTGSLQTYNRASDALGVLTSRTVARAGEASYRAQSTYKGARALIVIVIAFAGLSLVIAVNFITRFVSGPLLGLAAKMRSLAANDTSIEIDGAERRDEIGEMARAMVVFRGNAIELAHSQRGLVQQASMLEERLEAEQTLTNLQRNFVSMASHEFRTPLTIIDGQAQRLIALGDGFRRGTPPSARDASAGRCSG